MPHFPTPPTLVVSISFDIPLLLMGMCSTRLGVGSLWLGLPPPSRLGRQAPTSRSSSPTIIINGVLPLPLIPKEGFPFLKVDVASVV